MGRIPFRYLTVRHLDQDMRRSSIIQDEDFLAHRIFTSLRKHINPDDVVHHTEEQDGHTSDHIRRVPEGNITAVPTSEWRIPRHDEHEGAHDDGENECNVPSAEVAPSEADLGALATHEVETYGHEQVEDRGWISGEVDNKVESITCGRSEDHDHCKTPLDEIRPEGGAKRASGGPKALRREDSLST